MLHGHHTSQPCSSSSKTYFICSPATLAFLEAKWRLLRQFRPRHKSPAARRSEESRKSTLFVSTRAGGERTGMVTSRRSTRSGRLWPTLCWLCLCKDTCKSNKCNQCAYTTNVEDDLRGHMMKHSAVATSGQEFSCTQISPGSCFVLQEAG